MAVIVTALQTSDEQEAQLPSFGATNFDQVPMYAPQEMEHAAVRDLITNTVRSIESPTLLTWCGGGMNASWTCVGR